MELEADSTLGSINSVEKLDALLSSVDAAQDKFRTYSQKKVDEIFKRCALAANHNRLHLAKLAIEEAGMGNLEDKAIKNHFSAETVYNAYKDMKTCGRIQEDSVNGYVLYAEPVGILAGIVPCTNPTSTTIFKSLIALKTRNCIVFSPHPRTLKCTIATAKIIRDEAIKAGAPRNCIAWLDIASIDLCTQLMRHHKVAMIVATGAGGLIKSAYSSGKPCMGGGAGNTPVIIDETADIPLSVNSILLSKTFDNGMICASEQAVIAVESVADAVKDEFIRRGGYFLESADEKEKLARLIFKENAALNPAAVGQSAHDLINMAGIKNVTPGSRVILAELDKVGHNEPLSREKLCPCLGFYRAKNYDEALDIALKLVRFGGLGHTSVLYTNLSGIYYKERVKKFEDMMPTGRALLCMPSSQGAIGGLFNAKLNPSLSLGCGSWGGNSSTEGLQPKHLLNYKQVAERRGHELEFKAPKLVRIGEHCIHDSLKEILAAEGVLVKHVGILHSCVKESQDEEEVLKLKNVISDIQSICAEKNLTCTAFTDDALDDCASAVLRISTIMSVAKEMTEKGVDALIAVGGTHTLDAAKLVRLSIEDNGIDWELLGTRFMSLAQRIVKFPSAHEKIKFIVCISSTSAAGAEMSPYALVLNDTHGLKLPSERILTILDLSLIPDAALVDFTLAHSISDTANLQSALIALSNALESLVSLIATDKTRDFSEKGFCALSENLVGSIEKSKAARERCHEAYAWIGLASANAYLGIAEALSHQLIINFGIPSGSAKIMVLCQTILFNAEDAPSKLAAYPHYEKPKAKEQYAHVVKQAALLDATFDCSLDSCLEKLILYIQNLKKKLLIPESIKDYGISEAEFLEKVDIMAMEAFDDQFTKTNPRYPLITELMQILLDAFYGRSQSLRYDEAHRANTLRCNGMKD